MSISNTIGNGCKEVISFVKEIQIDFQKLNDGSRAERQHAIALRIIGVVALILSVYVGAPAVVAFLSGQPGAASSLLLGVVHLLIGHDFIVIGKNRSHYLRNIEDSVSLQTVKYIVHEVSGVFSNKLQMPHEYNGTWVVQPLWTALMDDL